MSVEGVAYPRGTETLCMHRVHGRFVKKAQGDVWKAAHACDRRAVVEVKRAGSHFAYCTQHAKALGITWAK